MSAGRLARIGEYVRAVSSAVGNVAENWNVLPWPGSLSTERVPFIRRTSVEEIVRPRPVPPKRRVVDPSA